jgi:biotin carboxyl carrier protein
MFGRGKLEDCILSISILLNLQDKPPRMPNDELPYKLKANDFLFSFCKSEIDRADCIKLSPGHYNLIKDHRNSTVVIRELDTSGKKLEVKIGGDLFVIEIKDGLDQVLEQMGFNAGPGKQVKEIKAPMPGLVLEIAVVNGQEVSEGDKLVVLEAMKMENNIMSHTRAKIKSVAVKPGQAVEKGQVLIELE